MVEQPEPAVITQAMLEEEELEAAGFEREQKMIKKKNPPMSCDREPVDIQYCRLQHKKQHLFQLFID